MTAADVLRGALAVALDADQSIAINQDTDFGGGASPTPPTFPTPQVKLSVRLTRGASQRLDRHVRAVGLARGAYLTQLIDGAPPVISSANRARLLRYLSVTPETITPLRF